MVNQRLYDFNYNYFELYYYLSYLYLFYHYFIIMIYYSYEEYHCQCLLWYSPSSPNKLLLLLSLILIPHILYYFFLLYLYSLHIFLKKIIVVLMKIFAAALGKDFINKAIGYLQWVNALEFKKRIINSMYLKVHILYLSN